MNALIYGLITGILFGFLLQKARILRYDKQIAALRLLDMTIVKFLLSAILVGMVGVYLFRDMGLVRFFIKPTLLGANIIGGLIFGIGWGLLGYCPATQPGALGEGRWDAIWGIMGMLMGAVIFAEVYPALLNRIFTWGELGKTTLPHFIGLNHWLVILIFSIAGSILSIWLEKEKL